MLKFIDEPALKDLLSDDQLHRLCSGLSALCRHPVTISEARQEGAVPIEFNLETVGWLSGEGDLKEREAASQLVAFILMFVAKYRLAANLHHDATEASYAELQRRNKALQASEARYRELSQNLQEKVDQQVETIRQTQQELYESARLRSVGHLAAGVAHEINNPIGFISSNLRVAREYVEELGGLIPAAPEHEELLNDFRDLLNESADGTRRISQIVADLKTFSSIDQSERSTCSVNKLLESALHLVQTEYNHVLDLRVRYEEVPELLGFASRLSQAFFNLLDNAAQAIQEARGDASDGQILVRTRKQQDTLQIIIQDNGCGIPEANQAQVFDAFFTTRPVGSGTGLGLTVSRDVVRAHGGQLRIESREGKGTRVTVTLPMGDSI